MNKKFTLITFGIIGTVLVFSTRISAQSSGETPQQPSIPALIQQIKDLQFQINSINSDQNLNSDIVAESGYFVSDLDLDSVGDEVKVLQTLLSMMADIYLGGQVTGYYGDSTKQAVMRLQKKNDLDQTGKVDEKTRAILNRHLKTHPVTLRKDPGPDYVKPQINSVIFINDSKTSATVNVVSNKNTTSTMWYGTSTPININKSNSIKSDIPGLLHSFTVQGLVPGLTYYYLVKVSDSFGIASSTEYSFIMK